MIEPSRTCTRCVMNESAVEITFDSEGVCNFCTEFLARVGEELNSVSELRQRALDDLVKKIKVAGKRNKYDCVVGVSGGVDSSWVLVQAVRLGLRPLAVHMDNGWNSELAQNNISNLVKRLGVDLHTHVIDWNEYKTLMQAFFDADVIDVELLYDNAMLAVNFNAAANYNIKYILGGTNQATEGMQMPKAWNWFKYDRRNIISIGRAHGNVKLKTFPSIGTFGFIWSRFIRGIQWVSILDFMVFNKLHVMNELQAEYMYKPYPYKHYESVFTRFYQGFILPTKFSVDKRRLHLSTLVMTGQMSRESALESLERIPYPDERDLEIDKQYFLKKMKWDSDVLGRYLERPERLHMEYASEYKTWERFEKLYRFLRKRISRMR